MLSRPIDIHDIDEGIDRKQLSLLKQRFLYLNQQRFQRTCAALSERQQQFLHLLPLLFDVNHPMLPGYVSHNTPAGIYQFSPDKDQLRFAKIIARSFNYQRDLVEKEYALDALFIMGSVGTIAQSDASDLDVWVCHSLEESHPYLHELKRKCTLISQWAAHQLHLEVHFFLMNAEEFSTQRKIRLTSEASGSAQHYLLLDEFYRTALWIAGKVPLWWFIPATQEENYNSYREKLIGRQFIKAHEVIDFGGLPSIPANEFIGAGVWQLYKAIESPYKSVLKLLLLEVYASANNSSTNNSLIDNTNTDPIVSLPLVPHPDTPSAAEPLALSLKRAVYHSDPDADLLDPYVMVYQRIEQHLENNQQPQRLDLARRCFYFKVNKALSRTSQHNKKSWQRILLDKMVANWGWSPRQLIMLDNRAYWKAPHVIAERALLVNELNHSYRLLNALSKQHRDEIAITTEELMILGRKLHAAFERKAGKVELINPGISRDISEDSLCFVRTGKGRSETDNADLTDGANPYEKTNEPSWKLIRGSQQDVLLRQVDVEPIKRSRSLVELLLWCHANQILESHSKIDILGSAIEISHNQKQQLLQLLQQWLPVPVTIEHEHFTRPARIERMLFIINTGVEPQAELHKKGMQMLSNQRDALGYSGLRENLIINADLIYINSWGELVCRHFASDALVNCLLHYFRLFSPGKPFNLPELSFRCFSRSQGNNIAQRLTELWRDLINCFYSSAQASNSRYILEMGDEYLLLQFIQQLPNIQRFKSYEKLLERLSQAQSDYSPIVIDRYGLRGKPLRLMCDTIKKRAIYLFYYLEGSEAKVTVIDEMGSIFSTSTQYHNQQTLLRPLVNFINTALERQLLDSQQTHNTPRDILIYELTGNIKQQQAVAEPRQLQKDLAQIRFINIKAIADMDSSQKLYYTIFCDEQEFSALNYGENLFSAVADYIVRRRQRGERYPCYITELDLSLCQNILAQQTGVQLGHYLQIKAELENKLNAALNLL
jgi:adenylate cyclase class 1